MKFYLTILLFLGLFILGCWFSETFQLQQNAYHQASTPSMAQWKADAKAKLQAGDR